MMRRDSDSGGSLRAAGCDAMLRFSVSIWLLLILPAQHVLNRRFQQPTGLDSASPTRSPASPRSDGARGTVCVACSLLELVSSPFAFECWCFKGQVLLLFCSTDSCVVVLKTVSPISAENVEDTASTPDDDAHSHSVCFCSFFCGTTRL